MSVYAISDLHLSFGAQKPMDIFDGWNNYIERLTSNWKNTIKDEDTIIIPGDISWAMKLEESEKDLKFLNSLPGKKVLIKGNHDFWWSTATKVEKFLEENQLNTISILFNSGKIVENICVCGTRGWMCASVSPEDKKILNREALRLERSLDFAAQAGFEPIVFLHYPPIYGSDESTALINIMIERKVKKCYYGHIHGSRTNKKIVSGNYKGIEMVLVSCDYIDFCPVFVS